MVELRSADAEACTSGELRDTKSYLLVLLSLTENGRASDTKQRESKPDG